MTNANTSETYNGWANRETWAFNLHWQNDQGLYGTVKEWARDVLASPAARGDDDDRTLNYVVGEYVIRQARELWSDLLDEMALGNTHGIDDPVLMWLRETGSWWRVDEREVGEAAREALGDG